MSVLAIRHGPVATAAAIFKRGREAARHSGMMALSLSSAASAPMFERLKRWLRGAPPHAPRAPATDSADKAPAVARPPASIGTAGVVVVDVRSEREFGATALDGAINVPLSQLEHHIRELVPDRSTPVVLYCASGARSGRACTLLRQLGYAKVTNAGGLHAAAAQLQLELRR